MTQLTLSKMSKSWVEISYREAADCRVRAVDLSQKPHASSVTLDSRLASLGLSFLIFKVGIIIVLMSQGFCKD